MLDYVCVCVCVCADCPPQCLTSTATAHRSVEVHSHMSLCSRREGGNVALDADAALRSSHDVIGQITALVCLARVIVLTLI